MTRQYIIGDIHGCWAELCALLDRLSPAAGDAIIALGDVLDRGPESERVLRFFRDRGDALSLLGNHERKHLRSARGPVRAALSQLIVREELGPRYGEWLDFLATLPRHLELPEAILAHGFFEPGVPLEEQRDEVVVGTLRGERRLVENYPGPWYENYVGPKPLVVGHHHYRGDGRPLEHRGLVFGLDTGCVHGFRLTALVLPEFRLVSVPARKDHWAERRRQFAHLAADLRTAEEDLEWTTLRSGARLPPGPDASPRRRQQAQICAELVERGELVVSAIVEQARRTGAAILARLGAAPDWQGCSDRERAARFAQQANAYAWRSLLFEVRKGRLAADEVYTRARTPSALFALAESMEIEVPAAGPDPSPGPRPGPRSGA